MILSSLRSLLAEGRKLDEALHALALSEIEAGDRRPGLWAKAIVQADGNDDRTKAEYIKLVVLAMKDQMHVEERAEGALEQEQLSALKRQRDEAEVITRSEAMSLKRQEQWEQQDRLDRLRTRAFKMVAITAFPIWLAGACYFHFLHRDTFSDSMMLSSISFLPFGLALVYLCGVEAWLRLCLVGGIGLWIWMVDPPGPNHALHSDASALRAGVPSLALDAGERGRSTWTPRGQMRRVRAG